MSGRWNVGPHTKNTSCMIAWVVSDTQTRHGIFNLPSGAKAPDLIRDAACPTCAQFRSATPRQIPARHTVAMRELMSVLIGPRSHPPPPKPTCNLTTPRSTRASWAQSHSFRASALGTSTLASRAQSLSFRASALGNSTLAPWTQSHPFGASALGSSTLAPRTQLL